MVRFDGLGTLISIVILVALLYLAYHWGKSGSIGGGFSNLGGMMGRNQ